MKAKSLTMKTSALPVWQEAIGKTGQPGVTEWIIGALAAVLLYSGTARTYRQAVFPELLRS